MQTGPLKMILGCKLGPGSDSVQVELFINETKCPFKSATVSYRSKKFGLTHLCDMHYLLTWGYIKCTFNQLVVCATF